jgi:hypothetical protein
MRSNCGFAHKIGGPAIALVEGMRQTALALVLVTMTACAGSQQQSNAAGDGLFQLLAMGVIGAGAAVTGAGQRSREEQPMHFHYPQDAYICQLDSAGGEEIHASTPERAHARCIQHNGERPEYAAHCRCELMNDHY